MDYEIRTITDDEVNSFRIEMSRAFGEDMSQEEIDDDRFFRDIMPLARTLAAFDDGQVVATFGDKELEVAVPGGAVIPMAGTTMVTVRQTHTRQGILRAMMTRHLEDAKARGDALAGLWASESAIYARFGFGMAVDRAGIDINSRLDWRSDSPQGSLREIDKEAAGRVLPAIYEEALGTRPGVLSRSPVRWKWHLDDREQRRDGMSAIRHVVFDGVGPEGGARPEGYVSYRMKEKWEDFHANGAIRVIELIASAPTAHEALWRHVTGIDLFPNVAYWNAPVDDELRFRVRSPRYISTKTSDSMWLRILDVCQALEARDYDAIGATVFEVTDPVFDDITGRYLLEISEAGATCRRTTAEPDVSMGVEVLGALYLGGRDLGALVRAGCAAGDAAAIRAANALMRWPLAPWCPEIF